MTADQARDDWDDLEYTHHPLIESIYLGRCDTLTLDGHDLAPGQGHLRPLAEHLLASIRRKLERLASQGTVTILGPEWSRRNPETAGVMHAELIRYTYGSTYALPNGIPQENVSAILSRSTDMYFLCVDGDPKGTSCLVDIGNGMAELGRSASKGAVGNTIIQDLRILEWLLLPSKAARFHTLVATLRTAPDREIGTKEESITMPGGQAIVHHWHDFPGLRINGIAPMYLKHGEVEQFAYATLTRRGHSRGMKYKIANALAARYVAAWENYYGNDDLAAVPAPRDAIESYELHAPPADSPMARLVHADVIPAVDGPFSLADAVQEAEARGAPFIQVQVPVDADTIRAQEQLAAQGFIPFQFNPGSEAVPPVVLFGRAAAPVVETHWAVDGSPHPFWSADRDGGELADVARVIEQSWTHAN